MASNSNIVHVNNDPSETVPENPEFLAELENLAKNRYTDEDEDFVAVSLYLFEVHVLV